jgi:hypothetical protein
MEAEAGRSPAGGRRRGQRCASEPVGRMPWPRPSPWACHRSDYSRRSQGDVGVRQMAASRGCRCRHVVRSPCERPECARRHGESAQPERPRRAAAGLRPCLPATTWRFAWDGRGCAGNQRPAASHDAQAPHDAPEPCCRRLPAPKRERDPSLDSRDTTDGPTSIGTAPLRLTLPQPVG